MLWWQTEVRAVRGGKSGRRLVARTTTPPSVAWSRLRMEPEPRNRLERRRAAALGKVNSKKERTDA
jgi:hypothetical protein